ncbi:MAG: 2-oxo acid dehydrogenase subunit E2, partial [Chloroflexi bacterium]|nr:2-oxo acid dehydrogenase subunit E2 [Chloroflexota bacterium]
MPTEVVMPELGEGVIEGEITRWLKQPGETINKDDALLEVATDKVDTEIPAPASGTLLEILVPEGETVDVGTVIARIGQEEAVPAGGAPVQVEPQSAPAAAPQAGSTNGDDRRTRVSPVVARIAAEHNVDITRIEGTGRYGRVTKKDILAYVQQRDTSAAVPAAPRAPEAPRTPVAQPRPAAPTDHQHSAPPPAGQPGEIVPLSRMRRLIAEHMVESKLKTAPHVTTVFEADLTAVVAHRAANKADFAARGVNLTFTAYFMAAAAEALREHPMVNSRWTDEGVLLHRDVHIGMATAIDDGLIVPVV